MKFKNQFSILLVLCSCILSGCYSTINNLTPKTMPQNPSNSYQIAMKIRNSNIKIPFESYSSRIIIDGVPHEMLKTDNLNFTFDYKIDENKHTAAYYYEISYLLNKREKSIKSKIFRLNIINRYAIGFECNRGRPYCEISLLGRGFTEGDKVVIGGYTCDTAFISPNVLTFKIPFIDGGKSYKAILDSDNGNIGLGEFFVDTLTISTEPTKLKLNSGDRQLLTITIDIDAPEFGLPLDITTDIPESVIMHDVSIQPGMRTATVIVEGGQPGEGSLFISAHGFTDCILPISVGEEVNNFEYSSLTDDDSNVNFEE